MSGEVESQNPAEAKPTQDADSTAAAAPAQAPAATAPAPSAADTSQNANETQGAVAEHHEPSVESANIDERIAARRLRIDRRIEARRKAEMADGDDFKGPGEEELSRGEKQVEASRQRLEKLIRDGNELVSNIRTACDARENQRRQEEEEISRQRKDKLDAEAKASAERFDEITKKWEVVLQREVPQELQEVFFTKSVHLA